MERNTAIWLGTALAVGITGYGVWKKKWWIAVLPTSLIPFLLARWARKPVNTPQGANPAPEPVPEPVPPPTKTAQAVDGYVEGVREQLGQDRAGETAVNTARSQAEADRLAVTQALIDKLRSKRGK